jgi:hypothetical protein
MDRKPGFEHFYADLDRLSDALEKLGAIKITADGFAWIDESAVPVSKLGASPATAYTSLLKYGYANGLI